jgi:hypothetical protein
MIPLLQSPALTQTLADPSLMVMVVVDSETVTPPTVSEWPGLMVVPLWSQLSSTPGKTALAGAGKIAHAIISSVAAVTAMRPAAVSPLLWFVLRCAGIFPTSIVLTVSATGGHFCPTVGDSKTPIRATSSAEGPRLR